MKKIAWITHRHIDGLEGGAEIADYNMINQAPADVEVDVFHTTEVEKVKFDEYYETVVTGFLGLSQTDEVFLSKRRPVVWVHDMATSGLNLYEYADPLIVTTPHHLKWEIQNNLRLRKKENVLINPGWIDTKPLTPGDKEPFALWAHRNVDHKGLDLAKLWAKTKGVDLKVMTDRAQPEVFEEMRKATWFVLLSHIQDPGPLSIIEAQLCGCRIVYNRKVGGFFEESAEELRNRVDRAGVEFWEAVLA